MAVEELNREEILFIDGGYIDPGYQGGGMTSEEESNGEFDLIDEEEAIKLP